MPNFRKRNWKLIRKIFTPFDQKLNLKGKLSEKMLFKKAYVPEQKLPVLVYTAAFLAPLTKQIK